MMTMPRRENPYGPITLKVLFNIWIQVRTKKWNKRLKVKKKRWWETRSFCTISGCCLIHPRLCFKELKREKGCVKSWQGVTCNSCITNLVQIVLYRKMIIILLKKWGCWDRRPIWTKGMVNRHFMQLENCNKISVVKAQLLTDKVWLITYFILVVKCKSIWKFT